jgi:hypothetical protein
MQLSQGMKPYSSRLYMSQRCDETSLQSRNLGDSGDIFDKLTADSRASCLSLHNGLLRHLAYVVRQYGCCPIYTCAQECKR